MLRSPIRAKLLVLSAAMIGLPGLAIASECGSEAIQAGRDLHTQGALEEVIEVYDGALETCVLTDAQAAHIHFRRGLVNFAKADFDSAASDHSAALRFGPDRPWFVLMARATSYMAYGQNDHAVADLTQAISLKPEQSALYLARMNANSRLGNDAAVQVDLQTIEATGDKSAMWQAYKIMGYEMDALTQ
jgi:tetratricopeptide (TPR) repeat protein